MKLLSVGAIYNFPTFNRWLKAQMEREDPVGDLARDANEDSQWPARAHKFDAFLEHLDEMNACDNAFLALDHAWNEWRCTK